MSVRSLAAASPITASSPVIINTVNPGLCHSSSTNNLPGVLYYVMRVMKFLLAKSAEEGSMALVCGTAAGPETHGEYMSECKIKPPAPLVLSKDGEVAQQRVWGELVKKLELISPGISRNITAA